MTPTLDPQTSQALLLRFPRRLDPNGVTALLSSLAGTRPPWWRRPWSTPTFVFEMISTPTGILHLMVVPQAWLTNVERSLAAYIPGVRAERVAVPAIRLIAAASYRLNTGTRSLRVGGAEQARALLAGAQPLHRDELIVLQWIVAPSAPTPPPPPSATGRSMRLPQDHTASRSRKIAEPLLLGTVRIGAAASSSARAQHLVRRVEAGLHLSNAPGARLERRMLDGRAVSNMETRRAPRFEYPVVMNSAELTGALAWPLEIESMAGLTLSGCPSLPPSQALLSRGIIYGDSIEHGTRRPVAADWPGLRHHTVVLGPTGVGKTTLMVNTATQVMHTMPSAGILVVDAKGDLIDQLLERLSEHDINRVVVVAPEDERPVGINPFKLIGVAPGLAAEQMTSTVHRMWESSWGPRTHDVISHAFATIAADPDGSLVDLGPLLSDTAFRKRAIGRITDPVLRQFWRGFENYSEAERQQVCAPALSRWRALMSRLPLRRTFSQPHPKFDLRTALDGGRIVLVRLSAGELGEDATALFGAVLMNAVWNVVQGRNTVPVDKRRPLLVMADEFQRFTSFGVPIEELLSQARSFNVAMMLGLQHLAQVPEKVHTSILSNVRSKITFQLGQKDAKLVATEFGRGLTSEDFQGLARYEVVASLFAAGRTQPPCTLDTRSPAPSSSVQPDMVRAHSRDRWGTPAEEIDAWVAERLMPPETPHELRKPPGRKRRDES